MRAHSDRTQRNEGRSARSSAAEHPALANSAPHCGAVEPRASNADGTSVARPVVFVAAAAAPPSSDEDSDCSSDEYEATMTTASVQHALPQQWRPRFGGSDGSADFAPAHAEEMARWRRRMRDFSTLLAMLFVIVVLMFFYIVYLTQEISHLEHSRAHVASAHAHG